MLKHKKRHTPGVDFTRPGTICFLELISNCCFNWSHIKQIPSQLWVTGKYYLNYIVHKLNKIKMFNKNNTCSSLYDSLNFPVYYLFLQNRLKIVSHSPKSYNCWKLASFPSYNKSPCFIYRMSKKPQITGLNFCLWEAMQNSKNKVCFYIVLTHQTGVE